MSPDTLSADYIDMPLGDDNNWVNHESFTQPIHSKAQIHSGTTHESLAVSEIAPYTLK